MSQVAQESGEALLEDMTKSKNSQRSNSGPTQHSPAPSPSILLVPPPAQCDTENSTSDNAGEDMECQSPTMAEVVPVLAPSS